jgi:hypothetical protein
MVKSGAWEGLERRDKGNKLSCCLYDRYLRESGRPATGSEVLLTNQPDGTEIPTQLFSGKAFRETGWRRVVECDGCG